MENWEYYIKLGGLIFGASGLWKLLELFIRSKMDKKLKAAETKHLQVQSEAQIVGNWIQWAQHLEQQVKSLEAVAEENKNLMELSKSQLELIESLKTRIKSLQADILQLTKEKEALQQQIENLKKK